MMWLAAIFLGAYRTAMHDAEQDCSAVLGACLNEEARACIMRDADHSKGVTDEVRFNKC